MCGISGCFSRESLLDSKIENSILAIEHRGPDESGFFADKFCSLGMCRLAIVDIKTGQQPNFNHDRSIVTIFNGEIYNFRDLHKLLNKRGIRVNSEGDSALIPFLYQEFGLNFPKLLHGMFAIAIYDVNQRKIVLVRDRLGKKPLWYYISESVIKFSSEIKGLAALGIERRLNLNTIQEFLQFGFINAPRSAFQDIFQLSPASILTYAEGQASVTRYWNPSEIEPLEIDYFEAKLEAEKLIKIAVESRLISERPIGAFLSGGIDSTIVASMMQKLLKEPIHTFSIGFAERKFDESPFARRVATSIGTIHHEEIVRPNPQLILEKLCFVLDQPFADSSIIPSFLLSKFAREQVVVAFSGDGADEAFGGYTRYQAARLLNQINPVLRVNPFGHFMIQGISNPRLRKLLQNSGHMSLMERYRRMQSYFQESDFSEIVNRELHCDDQSEPFRNLWHSIKVKDNLRKLQQVDIDSYLPGDLLYKVDIASMSNGLEVRSPFLDFRVVEFGLSLPANLKYRGRENKFLLREIARSEVSRHLIDRPKMGFGVPLASWLRNELRLMVRDTLLDQTSLSRGWYQPGKVHEILKLHEMGTDKSNLNLAHVYVGIMGTKLA